jgi:triacylglycerol lipase
MSANAKWDWPPGLSPTQSEAVPTWRAAYSDRTSALMALFCELAHDTFVADQPPADHAGAPTVAGKAGRNELKRRLEAGSFRLVQVFNKDQAFLAVREGHFAVLAFRGTEGSELLDTDLKLRLVPLPGVSGVMVHCGFLEVFSRCKSEIEAAVNESVPSTLGFYITGHSSVVHSLRSRRLLSTGITSRRATPLGLRESVPLALMSRLNAHTTG